MKMKIAMLIVGSAMIVISGCSSTIFKTHQFDTVPPTSVSIDAKQRMLVARTRSPTEDDPIERLTVCLEPSPDALVAASASFGGALAVPEKVGLEVAKALQEQAGQIGLRTHTVTLLRDGLFRACEAYSNGVIAREEYKQILNGYGALVLTMMAIEQASGVQSSTVVLSPGKARADAASEPGQESDQAGTSGTQPSGSASAEAGEGAQHLVDRSAVSPANAVVVRQLAGAYLLFQVGAAASQTPAFRDPTYQRIFEEAMKLLLSNKLPAAADDSED
jgi:hypothetical protein